MMIYLVTPTYIPYTTDNHTMSKRFATLLILLAVTIAAATLGLTTMKGASENMPTQSHLNAALIAAAGRGDTDETRRLLRQGASVTATDDQGRTALIAAAYGDHLEVGKLLIQAGADVNTQDNSRQSAYLIPTADGSLAFLRLTLQSGADVHRLDSYNGTGLIRAADRGHVEIIRELLTTDIAIDHVNRLGWTALLEAIILGNGGPNHTEVVRLLVAAGANVNLADSGGTTPLAHAQRRNFPEIITILKTAGAR